MPIDLTAVDDFADSHLEALPDVNALGTFSTASTVGTASCPVSSCGSIMTANCAS